VIDGRLLGREGFKKLNQGVEMAEHRVASLSVRTPYARDESGSTTYIGPAAFIENKHRTSERHCQGGADVSSAPGPDVETAAATGRSRRGRRVGALQHANVRPSSVAALNPRHAGSSKLFGERRLQLDSLPPADGIEVVDELRKQPNPETPRGSAGLVSEPMLIEPPVGIARGLTDVKAPRVGASAVVQQDHVHGMRRPRVRVVVARSAFAAR
jgi:hypothetical protein